MDMKITQLLLLACQKTVSVYMILLRYLTSSEASKIKLKLKEIVPEYKTMG